ncbi:hypothetical protein HK104_008023, partial [Borealophlyctis nickersoniae]
PLSIACRNGHTRIAEVLVEFGAEIGGEDMYGVTPLHWAANSGNTRLVEYILSKSAPSLPTTGKPHTPAGGKENASLVSRRDYFGSTPLHFASVGGFEDVVATLIRAGSDPTLANNDGRKASDVTTDDGVRAFLIEEETKSARAHLLAQRARKPDSASRTRSGKRGSVAPGRGRKDKSAKSAKSKKPVAVAADTGAGVVVDGVEVVAVPKERE